MPIQQTFLRSYGVSLSFQGDRAFTGGWYESNTRTNNIDYFNIASTGNASEFGDWTVAGMTRGCCSGDGRGVASGGGTNQAINIIDYITLGSLGNATDLGNLVTARDGGAAVSDGERGVYGGGYPLSGAEIQNWTIATTANASDFGDLDQDLFYLASCNDKTRGVWSGGGADWSNGQNKMQYVTIKTAGDASDFGDLNYTAQKCAGCESKVGRGIVAGGEGSPVSPGKSDNISYFDIATTGNASNFGDMSVGSYRVSLAAYSNETRGCFSGGETPSGPATNSIEYITIASTGNGTDFGDLTGAVYAVNGGSGTT